MLPAKLYKSNTSQIRTYHTGIYLRPPRIEDQPTMLAAEPISLATSASSVVASVRHSVVDFRAVLHHHHPHHSSLHGGSSGASSHNVVVGAAATSSAGPAGSPVGNSFLASSSSSAHDAPPHSPTPQLQRRLAKSFSVAPSGSHSKGWLSVSNVYTYLMYIFRNVLCV